VSDFDKAREVTILVTSVAQLASVYALLGGRPAERIVSGNAGTASAKPVIPAATEAQSTQESLASDGAGPSAQTDASPSDDNVHDAAGWPWDAALHASTKGMTKDGLWRMKVGVARPDPKPGFPITIGGTGTASTGTESSAPATAPAPAAGPDEDEDEFAAFRDAAASSDAADAAAKAKVPARKWTDADLGALCNQAAVKLGDPAPVKAIIAAFAAEGETPHSRNVPEDKRADFAAAVEAKAGIEFAG
jgi:hypothetical protein